IPDEAPEAASPPSVAMPDNPAYATHPSPAAALTGKLSFGHGHLVNHIPTAGQGIRAPRDYDARVTDEDTFILTYPTGPGPSGWLDRAWSMEWVVDAPAELHITAEFCDGLPGTCTPVTRSELTNSPFNFFYDPDPVASWNNRN